MKLLLIGIVGFIIMFVALYTIRNRFEGFTSGSSLTTGTQPSGTTPSPSQESAIPNSQPGSVSANPETSLASTQDLIAVRDSLKLFVDTTNKLNQDDTLYNIIDHPNTPEERKFLISYFLGMSESLLEVYNNELATQIKSKLQDVSTIRTTVDQLNDYLLTTSNKNPTLISNVSDLAIKPEIQKFENINIRIMNIKKPNIVKRIIDSNNTETPKEILIAFLGTIPVLYKSLVLSSTGKRPNTLSKKDYEEAIKLLDKFEIFTLTSNSGTPAVNPNRQRAMNATTVVPNDAPVTSNTTRPTSAVAPPTSLAATQRPRLLQRGRAAAPPLANRTAIYEIKGPYLNKDDLQELINRIQGERKRLVDLRSNAASIRARVDQLEKLSADVSAIRVQLVRGVIKPEEIPIETEGARAFLKNIQSDPVPPLIVPKGETTTTASDKAPAKTTTTGVAAGAYGIPLDSSIQKLMESAKDLKWSIEASVMYDPEVAQREKLLGRLANVEKALNRITVVGKEVDKATLVKLQTEIGTLNALLAKSTVGPMSGSITGDIRPELAVSTRIPTSSLTPSVYVPSRSDLSNASGSPDVLIRPGMLMSDEAIKRRASGSQPIASDMNSGVDFKQRTIELCNQIKSSGLGDPKEFGCIADPSQVGASYSWKGAHKMVCSRLGNTWGGFYPEMMGCGKYDAVTGFDGSAL
jgi:hypothetical protein